MMVFLQRAMPLQATRRLAASRSTSTPGPVRIPVGTAELFLFETRDWKTKCDAVGTPCEVIEMDGAIHDFAIMLALMPEAREVLPAQAAFLTARRA